MNRPYLHRHLSVTYRSLQREVPSTHYTPQTKRAWPAQLIDRQFLSPFFGLGSDRRLRKQDKIHSAYRAISGFLTVGLPTTLRYPCTWTSNSGEPAESASTGTRCTVMFNCLRRSVQILRLQHVTNHLCTQEANSTQKRRVCMHLSIETSPQARMHVCLLQAVFVPAFDLINCPLTFLTPRRRFFVLHMHHTLALHALHTFFPVLVVRLRRDEESKEHGRIHFANLQASNSPCVTR
jgi:hypothetical protein